MNETGTGRYRWLPAITALFVTSLIVANLIAVKIIQAGSLILPAAVIIFPLSYIFGDVLTEVYGYGRARRVIWTGFACNLLAVLAMQASMYIPAAPFWTLGSLDSAVSNQAYEALLGYTPRLLAASFAAYLVGEFLNAFVLAKMKIMTAGRFLWMRTIGSTIAGQLADSAIFVTAAFWGMIPPAVLGTMIVTQWLVKSAYETAFTPFTYLIVGYLKRVEHSDVYDRHTRFNPLLWGDHSRETSLRGKG
jgi:queuosine precursor transporter